MKDLFYGLAFWMVLVGALIIEGAPGAAFGLIAGAGLCVRIAEKMKRAAPGVEAPETARRYRSGE